MTISIHTDIADSIRRTFPTCPEEFIDEYLTIYHSNINEIVKRAKFTLDKPYGQNHILKDVGEYGLSFAEMAPGQNCSTHFHNVRREFFCVKTGTLTLTKDGNSRELVEGECQFSTPGEPHSLANRAASPLAVLEIFSPALISDKVRIEDRYKRKLGKVIYTE